MNEHSPYAVHTKTKQAGMPIAVVIVYSTSPVRRTGTQYECGSRLLVQV